MDTAAVIQALAALAHEHRLAIFRLLVEQGPEGLAAGEIAARVGLVPSSLTFHLQHLHRAGLVTQRRVSRQLFYAVNFAAMDGLLGFLTKNCCVAADSDCATQCAPGATEKPSLRAARASRASGPKKPVRRSRAA